MKTEYITLDFDTALSCGHSILIAGVDEVGRGSLFGPVVAAAVILPPSALPELVAALPLDLLDSVLVRGRSVERSVAVARRLGGLNSRCSLSFA